MTWFTLSEAARRYDLYRPQVHAVALEWLSEAVGPRRFRSALDIACGTGHSTIPLTRIADQVLGIDASPAMLEQARLKGLTVRQQDFLELQESATFDLLWACMAWHWFDPAIALQTAKRISQPGAVWLIYNFYFSCHQNCEPFNDWFLHEYLVRYPSPPRHRFSGESLTTDPSLKLLTDSQGILPLSFSAEELVNYLTTQSNIEAAVQSGRRYEEITAELLERIPPLPPDGSFRYQYDYAIYRFQPD